MRLKQRSAEYLNISLKNTKIIDINAFIYRNISINLSIYLSLYIYMSAQISQNEDERNLYKIMKTMCPPNVPSPLWELMHLGT